MNKLAKHNSIANLGTTIDLNKLKSSNGIAFASSRGSEARSVKKQRTETDTIEVAEKSNTAMKTVIKDRDLTHKGKRLNNSIGFGMSSFLSQAAAAENQRPGQVKLEMSKKQKSLALQSHVSYISSHSKNASINSRFFNPRPKNKLA